MEFQRLLLLLRQLGKEYEAEHGKERGAPAWIAKRTGLSLSYVRKYLDGSRTGVTVDKLEEVRQRLRLSRRFFYDASLGASPRYQDFIGAPDHVENEAFGAFRVSYPRYHELSARQVEQLREMEFRGGRPSSPHVYRAMADWMLDGGGEPVRAEETAARAAREGVAKVGDKYRKRDN